MSQVLIAIPVLIAGLVISELAYRSYGGAAGTIDALTGFLLKAFWVAVGVSIAVSGNAFLLFGVTVVAIAYFMWRRDAERLGVDEWTRRKLEGWT